MWTELWAKHAGAMAKFYAAIGNYDIVGGAIPGEDNGYHLAAGGFARAGILPNPIENTSSTWIPYVRVKSVEEAVTRARAAGGYYPPPVVVVPPGGRPQPPAGRPPGHATTLPADVGGGSASTRPSMPPSRPSASSRPAPSQSMSRPAPRPMPRARGR